jgi:D-glycerate 3-kinase
VIIFEGWCVGAKAEENKTLKKSINSLEKANDQNLFGESTLTNN